MVSSEISSKIFPSEIPQAICAGIVSVIFVDYYSSYPSESPPERCPKLSLGIRQEILPDIPLWLSYEIPSKNIFTYFEIPRNYTIVFFRNSLMH